VDASEAVVLKVMLRTERAERAVERVVPAVVVVVEEEMARVVEEVEQQQQQGGRRWWWWRRRWSRGGLGHHGINYAALE
jgi:hypothetical protein